jgi:hypothetical protein
MIIPNIWKVIKAIFQSTNEFWALAAQNHPGEAPKGVIPGREAKQPRWGKLVIQRELRAVTSMNISSFKR